MAKQHVFPTSQWKIELAVGFLLLAIGAFLVWDSMDNSGRKLPWPLSGLAFW